MPGKRKATLASGVEHRIRLATARIVEFAGSSDVAEAVRVVYHSRHPEQKEKVSFMSGARFSQIERSLQSARGGTSDLIRVLNEAHDRVLHQLTIWHRDLADPDRREDWDRFNDTQYIRILVRSCVDESFSREGAKSAEALFQDIDNADWPVRFLNRAYALKVIASRYIDGERPTRDRSIDPTLWVTPMRYNITLSVGLSHEIAAVQERLKKRSGTQTSLSGFIEAAVREFLDWHPIDDEDEGDAFSTFDFGDFQGNNIKDAIEQIGIPARRKSASKERSDD